MIRAVIERPQQERQGKRDKSKFCKVLSVRSCVFVCIYMYMSKHVYMCVCVHVRHGVAPGPVSQAPVLQLLSTAPDFLLVHLGSRELNSCPHICTILYQLSHLPSPSVLFLQGTVIICPLMISSLRMHLNLRGDSVDYPLIANGSTRQIDTNKGLYRECWPTPKPGSLCCLRIPTVSLFHR